MNRTGKSTLSALIAILSGFAIFAFSAQAADPAQWSTQAERDTLSLVPPGNVNRTAPPDASPPSSRDYFLRMDKQIQRAAWNQLREVERERRRNQLHQNIRQHLKNRRNGAGDGVVSADAATAGEQSRNGASQAAQTFDLRRQTSGGFDHTGASVSEPLAAQSYAIQNETRLAINSAAADPNGVGSPHETPTLNRTLRPDNARAVIFRPPSDNTVSPTPIDGENERPPDSRLGGNDRPSPGDDGGTGSTRPPDRRNRGR
jgi:hypothetical protein